MKNGFLPSGLAIVVGKMQANPSPWCLKKQTAGALVRRRLARKVGKCPEHGGPVYQLTERAREVLG